MDSLLSYFSACRLTPPQILERERPVVFVDLVFHGSTFDNLSRLLQFWSGAPAVWRQLRRHLRWVAIVGENPPDDTAWQSSDSRWTNDFDRAQVQTVLLDFELWCYLANEQFKTTSPHTAQRWRNPASGRPPKDSWFLYAARGARELYRCGERSRNRLAALLDEAPRPDESIATLARELRRESGKR